MTKYAMRNAIHLLLSHLSFSAIPVSIAMALTTARRTGKCRGNENNINVTAAQRIPLELATYSAMKRMTDGDAQFTIKMTRTTSRWMTRPEPVIPGPCGKMQMRDRHEQV